jgi:hypothetical protein
MAATLKFNPDRIAHFEAIGWRAYYDRKWLKMLVLLVRLCQEQFHIPFPLSLLASYYTVRASIAWVPVNHDERKVLKFLEKFYWLAQPYSGFNFDAERVAALELRYFAVHRRLSGEPNRDDFVQVMVELHSAIFCLSAERVHESAEWRVMAADTVDRITSKTSTDVEGDWAKLEEYLRRCYRSIEQELKER